MSRRRENRDNSNQKVFASLILITQFGINMLVPICIMSAVGIWLDRKFQTPFWTILLFFVGAIAGAQNVYRMAKNVYTSAEKKKQDEVLEEKPHDRIEK